MIEDDDRAAVVAGAPGEYERRCRAIGGTQNVRRSRASQMWATPKMAHRDLPMAGHGPNPIAAATRRR